jgi:hypothetical protein
VSIDIATYHSSATVKDGSLSVTFHIPQELAAQGGFDLHDYLGKPLCMKLWSLR